MHNSFFFLILVPFKLDYAHCSENKNKNKDSCLGLSENVTRDASNLVQSKAFKK